MEEPTLKIIELYKSVDVDTNLEVEGIDAKIIEEVCLNKKVIIFNRQYTKRDAEQHPKWLFVYGDNTKKMGILGQALLRGMPNAVGMPIKEANNEKTYSFYRDATIIKNKRRIDKAINLIKEKMKNFDALVFPIKGLSTKSDQPARRGSKSAKMTNLERLEKKAPITLKYILEQLTELTEYVKKGSSEGIVFIH